MAATNEKFSNYIPDDLAFSILSKLPLKSLKRFGCLRKSWSLLFENPHFMSMYRNNFLSNHRSYYHDASLLLNLALLFNVDCKCCNQLYSISEPERFENRIKLDFPNPFQEATWVDISGPGSINGTLCLHASFGEIVVLWNPATKEFKVIPPSPVESSSPDAPPQALVRFHGFGYDHVRDDYKVIRHVTLPMLPNSVYLNTLWEIYSLRSNSSNKLDVDMPVSHGRSENIQVYTDGVCHWLCEDFKHNYIRACLVSFKLSNEEFFNTPISFDIDDSFAVGVGRRDLVVLNGSIALISYHEQLTNFHISILGELGVKESWTKLFIVGPLPCVDLLIGVGKTGEIFFRRKDEELAWFDLSTQMVEELGVKGMKYGNKIVIYKESLLPIGGIKN